ncbi:MAG: ChaN family lipoprotein [Alphaproteobacteria bacterium]|nr:ChaN family lipoprotein [Alphaproteobacteria bacterium]MCW5740312.1 ChaN family lipoprotein [Alphaproteobacteria bacterium]
MNDVAHTPDFPKAAWFAPARARTIPAAEILDDAARADVVMLGETHDRAEIHRWQMHVCAALHARRPNMAVGFEMFQRRQQPVLDRWVAGELSTDAFLLEAEWFDVWGFDPEIYLPLFHFCRQHRVRMLAINCYRALVTRVRKEGWDAIPEAERDGLTPSAPPTEGYRRYLADIVGRALPADVRFDGFIAAQQTWDRAFAVNMKRALEVADPPLVIGIIGRGHLEFGHGTPHQLRDLGVANQRVLLPHEDDRPLALSCAPGIADAIFHLDTVEPPAARTASSGLRWETGSMPPLVQSVDADSPAAEAGVLAGDRITAIDGLAVATPVDAFGILRRQPAGRRVSLAVQRDGQSLDLELHLVTRT